MADRRQRIHNLIQQSIRPEYLAVTNNSAAHSGHAGNPDGSGETHYALELSGENLPSSRVEAQRVIHKLLAEEFASGLHALEIRIRR